ncbi:alpha/beta hydrolase, partial [Burkholderia gladioli]|nr:alpha/beta hydrolase [Burkholderia gladioli]
MTVASTLEGDSIAAMAAAILASAPPRFALVGFSMGGYLAHEILRRAPERVT